MLAQALAKLEQSAEPDGATFTYKVTEVSAPAGAAGTRKEAATKSSAPLERRTPRRRTKWRSITSRRRQPVIAFLPTYATCRQNLSVPTRVLPRSTAAVTTRLGPKRCGVRLYGATQPSQPFDNGVAFL